MIPLCIHNCMVVLEHCSEIVLFLYFFNKVTRQTLVLKKRSTAMAEQKCVAMDNHYNRNSFVLYEMCLEIQISK